MTLTWQQRSDRWYYATGEGGTTYHIRFDAATTLVHRAASADDVQNARRFHVISEGRDGEHVARTYYAADHDDARRTHLDNYADEPIVAVHQ